MRVNVYIDTGHGVHNDGKGHTGVIAMMGGNMIHATSNKQKLVTRSSFEAELVGLADGLQWVKWLRLFLLEQKVLLPGQEINIFQDNKSTILAATRGHNYSSRTKHINIRYFEVKEMIESKNIKITYKPTGEMLADFLTKPLHGGLLRKLVGAAIGNEKDG